MPTENSAGTIVFRKEKGNIDYLLLHYEAGHWSFIKGKIEKGEQLKETVQREVEEETGISDIKFIEGFKENIDYFFKSQGKTIYKKVTYFLAETKSKEVKLSFEHTEYKWLPYEKALGQLTYKNSKQVLKAAHKFITGQ